MLGIDGLVVNGIAYDAVFYDGSYNDFKTEFDSPDYTDEFAENASNALAGFLGSNPILPGNISGCSNTVECYLATTLISSYDIDPNDTTPDTWYVHVGQFGNLTGVNWSGGLAHDYTNYTNVTQVYWEATAVPLPGAVWLFGSALLGLVGIARRNRHTK